VLTTWSEVVLRCVPGERCCNLPIDPAKPSSQGVNDVPYSIWLGTYWRRELQAHGLVVNDSALLGYGKVGANPTKSHRNCTLHLGCWPSTAAEAHADLARAVNADV
jgi:hypothetical protein